MHLLHLRLRAELGEQIPALRPQPLGAGEIKKLGAAVIGVSVDSVEAHKKFKTKFDLNFPLLADTDKKMVEAYGTWKEKSMYGKKYMGTERNTFVIDRTGRISSIFRKVKPEEHVSLVRDALNELAAK